ncbi:DNA adenine methylase [Hydrogenophaga sp.]|uniref:DNA adenine methylase n=1 Tax=Hydrogenophaga sp. TaxID=1904254 RepID=UPI00272F8554|nr:DNA adenine methylase [Hydrogenophaga sp.]MDP2015609.1 DNA adenine methylase [Hydrogenophaga sp.]
MFSKHLYSPLRYPGGKARFAPFVTEIMHANHLSNGHYLEPYAGGAGVALNLLFQGVASHIHINDLDPAVFDFWQAITTSADEVLQLLHDTPINLEQWLYWRSVLRRELDVDLAKRGFATLFMNRTNRSGVLKGGVIGGLRQDGIYKMDARLKKNDLAARITAIADHASQISVYQEDALSLLSRSAEFLPKNSLIYLDPPYYIKGQGLYRNFYEHEDHVQVANLLQSSKFSRPWIVSYDNVDEIRAMYTMSRSLSYGLHYTAQARYIGSEIMFFQSGLTIPENSFPASALAA